MCWGRPGSRSLIDYQILQVIVIVLGYPWKQDSKTLLLKDNTFLNCRTWRNKDGIDLEVPSLYWLAIVVLEGVMHAIRREK